MYPTTSEIKAIHEYLLDRSEAHITRWHAWPHIHDESVAEHEFYVARNALMLCLLLEEYDIASVSILQVLIFSLQHDVTERITGDVSGVAKRKYPPLKVVLSEIEDSVSETMFSEFPAGIGRFMKHFTSGVGIYNEIVKYADLMDAYSFALNERKLGNSFMEEHIPAIAGYMAECQWPWLQQLRKHVLLP